MSSATSPSALYCLGGLKTIHGRYVVDERLFVKTDLKRTPLMEEETLRSQATGRDMTILRIQARPRAQRSFSRFGERNPPPPSPPSFDPRSLDPHALGPHALDPLTFDRLALDPPAPQLTEPDHRRSQKQNRIDGSAHPTSIRRAPLERFEADDKVIQFRTREHPRERGARLFDTLGPGVKELVERAMISQGALCVIEPLSADWGGFPTAALLMLLGVPAATAAAALAEAFAPLNRQESLRRQIILDGLLTDMEHTYGSSVRFALAHGSDASLLGELRFSYLVR